MDLETLVAVAQRRLRLRRLLVMIERHPEMLGNDMALKIRKPMELVGLKGRMVRTEDQEKTIARLGERYDAVHAGIDELVAAHTEHVGDLEAYESELRRKIEGMVGSNGDPTDGQDGQDYAGPTLDDDGRQVISSKTVDQP